MLQSLEAIDGIRTHVVFVRSLRWGRSILSNVKDLQRGKKDSNLQFTSSWDVACRLQLFGMISHPGH